MHWMFLATFAWMAVDAYWLRMKVNPILVFLYRLNYLLNQCEGPMVTSLKTQTNVIAAKPVTLGDILRDLRLFH